jgi:hypothetical protein
LPFPRDFSPRDDGGYISGAPYSTTASEWDPESIDSPERYWPYARGSGADRGVKSRPLKSSERSDSAPFPLGASPARIPDPHLTPDSTTDPEGGTA